MIKYIIAQSGNPEVQNSKRVGKALIKVESGHQIDCFLPKVSVLQV